MKSLTVLQTHKLKAVLKLITQLQITLQSIGLTHTSIRAYLFDLLSSNLTINQYLSPIGDKILTLESLNSMLSNDGSSILKQLKKIEVALYMEKLTFSNGSQVKTITLKTSENQNEKAKKQKKDKKQKQNEKQKQKQKNKNNQNSMNIFAVKNTNSQNIIIQVQKSSKEHPKPNQVANIFKPTGPLLQSSLLNYNIFGGVSGAPSMGISGAPSMGVSGIPSNGLVNIFQRSVQNEPFEVSQGSQDRPGRQVDQREELRKNLRQIQIFKQFVESQMMMEMMGQQNDDIDSVNLSGMGSFMFGR